LYERLFAEALLYFYRNRDRFEDWQIVIIYPSRSKEQTKTRPYRAFLASEQVHRIYLDELGELEQLPLKLGLLVLTTLDQNQAPAAARYLINRSQQEISEPTATRAIMEIITEERQRAGGRRQEVESIFLPSATGSKAPKFIYAKQKNMYCETRSARNTASVLNPLNLFMGIPPASCLLPPAFLTLLFLIVLLV
jgi:hypothetical protein